MGLFSRTEKVEELHGEMVRAGAALDRAGYTAARDRRNAAIRELPADELDSIDFAALTREVIKRDTW